MRRRQRRPAATRRGRRWRSITRARDGQRQPEAAARTRPTPRRGERWQLRSRSASRDDDNERAPEPHPSNPAPVSDHDALPGLLAQHRPEEGAESRVAAACRSPVIGAPSRFARDREAERRDPPPHAHRSPRCRASRTSRTAAVDTVAVPASSLPISLSSADERRRCARTTFPPRRAFALPLAKRGLRRAGASAGSRPRRRRRVRNSWTASDKQLGVVALPVPSRLRVAPCV